MSAGIVAALACTWISCFCLRGLVVKYRCAQDAGAPLLFSFFPATCCILQTLITALTILCAGVIAGHVSRKLL